MNQLSRHVWSYGADSKQLNYCEKISNVLTHSSKKANIQDNESIILLSKKVLIYSYDRQDQVAHESVKR